MINLQFKKKRRKRARSVDSKTINSVDSF